MSRRRIPPPRAAVAALLAAAALAPWCAPATAATAADAATAAWRVPRPVERTLGNGLRVTVFPDARRGLVHVVLRLPAGVASEPEGQEGVANLTAQLVQRGTTTRDAGAFALEALRLGAPLQAGAAREWATLSATWLARDWESGLELVADAVTNPVFLAPDVQRASLQTVRALENALASPATAAEERLWLGALDGNPAARPPFGTPGGVVRLQREAVRQFHRACWRPGGSVLIVAGAVDPERVFAAAGEAFAAWEGTAEPLPAPARPAPRARVVLLDRAGPLADVRLGVATPGRGAADDPARSIAARLFEEALARRAARWGAVGGDARASFVALGDAGLWSVAASAPADSAEALVRRLRGAWREFLAAPPAAAETRRVTAALAGAFPFQFETLAGLVAQWNTADFTGAGAEGLARWPDAVRALDPQAVRDAARRGVDLERATLVVVGPADRLRAALERFGPVEVVRPGGDRAADFEASPAERAEARRLVAVALAAHGGEAVLRGIHDSITESAVEITVQGNLIRGRLRQVRQEPDRLSFLTRYQEVEQRQVLDGRRAWTQTAGGPPREADSATVETLRGGFHADLPHLLLQLADTTTAVAARGVERVGPREARRVEALLPGGERRGFLFDAENGRLLAMDATERVAGGAVPARRLYRDYRTVQGVVWPHLEERQVAGERLMLITTESVRLNAGVADAEFAPSAAPPAPADGAPR